MGYAIESMSHHQLKEVPHVASNDYKHRASHKGMEEVLVVFSLPRHNTGQ